MRYLGLLVLAAACGSFPVSAQTVITLPGAVRPQGKSDSTEQWSRVEQGPDPRMSAGGIELVLPGPSNGFEEAGEKLRVTFFGLLVPANDRLLTAYVSSQKLAELNEGKSTGGLGVYGLVQVPRQFEYEDCTPRAFEKVSESMDLYTSKTYSGTMAGLIQEQANGHLKSIGVDSVEMGRPKMLGRAFQDPNASGFLMQAVLKVGTREIDMAGGFAALRVKQRLIFASLWRRNESPDTVHLVSTDLETWANAILEKNK